MLCVQTAGPYICYPFTMVKLSSPCCDTIVFQIKCRNFSYLLTKPVSSAPTKESSSAGESHLSLVKTPSSLISLAFS